METKGSDNREREPETVTIASKLEHKQTFIFLHGRGDTARSFGPGLTNTGLPDGSTLQAKFPHAKWIFPQAPLMELAVDPTWKVYQWFDVWSLHPGAEEDDIQISGLKSTVNDIHLLLEQEINLVGAKNVVLGGLSQGCASSLTALLLWEGEPFAACIGMSGWLPFRKVLETAAGEVPPVNSEERPTLSPAHCANFALKKKLELPGIRSVSTTFQNVPIFMGHGLLDHVVVPQLGKEAVSCLKKAQAKIWHQEYEGLAHWYSSEMLSSAAAFMEARLSANYA